MNIPEEIKLGMLQALMTSMPVVRRYQNMIIGAVEKKADGSIVTSVDKASEAAGKEVLRKIPRITIHGEETGVEGAGDITVYLDPLDGTVPFAIGSTTSTVIVAAVENTTGAVICCFVGVPISGMMVGAEIGKACQIPIVDYNEGVIREWLAVKTFKGALDRKSRVFVDSCPGFTKSGRTIMSTDELNQLHATIQEKSGILALGSNGLHHALVAKGGHGAVGAITTAIGGPWDVCPVLLVLAAGGAARAFSRMNDGTLKSRDPLIVGSYDILITANSEDTVRELMTYVLNSCTAG